MCSKAQKEGSKRERNILSSACAMWYLIVYVYIYFKSNYLFCHAEMWLFVGTQQYISNISGIILVGIVSNQTLCVICVK